MHVHTRYVYIYAYMFTQIYINVYIWFMPFQKCFHMKTLIELNFLIKMRVLFKHTYKILKSNDLMELIVRNAKE
jgi:hypothetical protein